MNAVDTTEAEEAAATVARYADAIEYFDTHDLGDELEAMPEVKFQINLPPRRTYYPVEAGLSKKVREIARQRGVSAETLVNLWVQERATEILTVGASE